ncbi:WD repeat containing protein [Lasiodiplodia theobromae]|uniref:Putative WD repeat-containing protein n=1 Tax=Lasiodiplodia theobromae TaxID=45133 RepID=A0A5N5DJX9_9PEZI|nr:WD repeat containing protein [Lasiodiplodia theobromae]KAB2578206.1 putative WD repeat-containing protein [Lasiodiplodia theobromae]KAF4534125.1 WD repeat containing protein [Lasiodiplodia theobromae]
MRTAKLVAESDLSLPKDSYIYSLRQTNSFLTALSSDNSIRTFDPKTLQLLPGGVIGSAHSSVTCLETYSEDGNVLATAGRDGLVKCWDRRTKKAVMEFRVPKPQGLSALEVSSAHHAIIAGTELEDRGPGDSFIYAWDARNASAPRLTLPESHTDTITELSLHPTNPSTLLSASTDGLVSIFDLTQNDEDDALRQVINHRSAVHHAGFASPTDVYVFGTDETLAFYQYQDSDDPSPELTPVKIGDVREKLTCEYVVNVYRSAGSNVVVAGNHSEQRLDLLPLHNPPSGKPLDYSCSLEDCLRLPGAHGEEIVRDVFIDSQSSTIYTCGEDGKVRSWRAEGFGGEQAEAEEEEVEEKKSAKEKKHKDKHKKKDKDKGKDRYKPY